ncbi:hypothetical protein Anae109_1079 [Anaeromyxobacter sp. Fw109-5]|nr:hypothetical protein Anae109_1079 [Anaeromyxobacter sp. Fw109-5]
MLARGAPEPGARRNPLTIDYQHPAASIESLGKVVAVRDVHLEGFVAALRAAGHPHRLPDHRPRRSISHWDCGSRLLLVAGVEHDADPDGACFDHRRGGHARTPTWRRRG